MKYRLLFVNFGQVFLWIIFAKHLYFAWYVSFLFFATNTGKFKAVYVGEYPRIYSVNVQVNLSELVILFSQKLSENQWFSNDFKGNRN